jgi:hypothetical protein
MGGSISSGSELGRETPFQERVNILGRTERVRSSMFEIVRVERARPFDWKPLRGSGSTRCACQGLICLPVQTLQQADQLLALRFRKAIDELLLVLDHFPLQHFVGFLAGGR